MKKFVLISRYRNGHATGMTEAEPFGVRSGDIALRDFTRSFEVLQYPSDVDLLFVPHRVLGLYEADLPAVRVLPEDASEAAPLEAALTAAFDGLSGRPDRFSFLLHERLLACVRAVLQKPAYSYSIRRSARLAQRAEINDFIEDNLEKLDLSAELILPEFGLSRATLYRLFEAEGGVRKYIVDRRLFRALLDISEGGARRGRIQLAAKRWGFSSAANFNRSVRQVFGGTPGALFRPTEIAESDTGPDFSDEDLFSRGVWASFQV